MKSDILSIVEKIKNRTGVAFAETLGKWPRDCSELDIADAWLHKLRSDPDFYEDGWYMPPPHGIITLFGKPEDRYQRVCEASFRPEYMWPRKDMCYAPEDIFAVYASPVHKETKLIGDFGLTLYMGSSKEVHQHCENVLQTSLHIARNAKVGMPFRELYQFGMDYGAKKGFKNDIVSPSDPTDTNIGHSIPLSWQGDSAHDAISHAKSFEEIMTALRYGRKFVNGKEEQLIEENMAFTVEPRFSTSSLPQAWFHLTVIFENGERRIAHGFRPVFEKCRLNHLSRLLPQ